MQCPPSEAVHMHTYTREFIVDRPLPAMHAAVLEPAFQMMISALGEAGAPTSDMKRHR